MTDTKRCSACGLDLPIGSFGRNAEALDGLRYSCRECTSKGQRARMVAANVIKDAEVLVALKAGGAPLIAFGSDMERAAAEAVIATGSVADAAEQLSVTPRQIRAYLSELQRRAAARGYSPGHDMVSTAPDGFRVKGVSSYYKIAEDGSRNLIGQWVKNGRDEDDRVAMLARAVESIADNFRGAHDPAVPPPVSDDDLLCVYPMGDPHLGMYAWAAETGQNFDLEIAERNLVAAVDHLVGLAPPAKHALIINLGDFFHADNSTNQTLRSHHALDVDSRWAKVLATGVRTMRRLIDRALVKHEHVTVICEIGNHDDHSAVMLALALSLYYEREIRVTIDTSPSKFHWYRFGACLLGVTHGDTCKASDLPGVMAVDQARAWGETAHRYWYTGHVHHDSLREYPGCTVETFRTLAPRDVWHSGKGYRSEQDMKCDVIHREHGRVNRHVVGIRQIWSTKKEDAS